MWCGWIDCIIDTVSVQFDLAEISYTDPQKNSSLTELNFRVINNKRGKLNDDASITHSINKCGTAFAWQSSKLERWHRNRQFVAGCANGDLRRFWGVNQWVGLLPSIRDQAYSHINAGRQADPDSKLKLGRAQGCSVPAAGEPTLALERETDHLQEGPHRVQAGRLSRKDK